MERKAAGVFVVRDTLNVFNKTQEGGDGTQARRLKLEWRGDTEDEPVLNEIDPGEDCHQNSKSVSVGDHEKNFVIRVLRMKDGDDEEIGTFTHTIDNGGVPEALTDNTWIYAYVRDGAMVVSRRYFVASSGGVDQIDEPIGDPVSLDVW
jgi:hypothetical protein